VSSRSNRERLKDILDSTEAILSYTKDLTYEQFAEDRKTNRAVSFELVVIGEAVSRLSEDFEKRYSDLPWREMNAVRNYAVHEYFRLSLPILWQIASMELPQILERLQKIYAEIEK
jgi:uncharacterized protein with HEPN domain